MSPILIPASTSFLAGSISTALGAWQRLRSLDWAREARQHQSAKRISLVKNSVPLGARARAPKERGERREKRG